MELPIFLKQRQRKVEKEQQHFQLHMFKIDYISAHDPRNMKTWSGLNYFIMKALEAQGATINIITGLTAKPNFGLKWRWHFYRLFGKNYQYERTHCYTRQFGEQVNSQLSADADVIFSTASEALPYIRSNKPIVLYKDGLFHNVAEYYQHFSHLPASSKKMGDATEKMALYKCTRLAFSSDWAAATAINYYGLSGNKVQVIPFGANLPNIPSTAQILTWLGAKQMHPIRLLWAGVSFDTKGGRIALEVARLLIAKGIETFIDFIGVRNEVIDETLHFASFHGFLDKSNPQHIKKIESLYMQAHFFIFPTIVDCTPVVLSEANAFGLPILTTNVSGIPSIVTQGNNGFMFAPNAAPIEYVNCIEAAIEQECNYKALSKNARMMYDEKLNWKTAGERLFHVITEAYKAKQQESKYQMI